MSRFPSNTTMILSILIIAVLSSMRYSRKLDREHFQLKFDWKNKQEILTIQQLYIDSIDYNFIRLTGIKEVEIPDNQHTFAIHTKKKGNYYFRFIDAAINHDVLSLQSVEWLTGTPELESGYVDLIAYDVEFEANGGKTVVTIGDELLIKDEAKYFRRKIASESKVEFIGSQKDVFNYRHEASYSNRVETILDNVAQMPDADFYIVLMYAPPDSSQHLIPTLIDDLTNRTHTQKVIWITVPDLRQSADNRDKSMVGSTLNSLHNDKLEVLDATNWIQDDIAKWYMADGVHLNKPAYEQIAMETVKRLQ